MIGREDFKGLVWQMRVRWVVGLVNAASSRCVRVLLLQCNPTLPAPPVQVSVVIFSRKEEFHQFIRSVAVNETRIGGVYIPIIKLRLINERLMACCSLDIYAIKRRSESLSVMSFFR